MGWSVDIVAPPGMPDVNEPISSMCDCPGNIATLTPFLGYEKIPHMQENPQEIMKALSEMVNELDKGNDGAFSDRFAIQCDKDWSEERESKQEWESWASLHNNPYAEMGFEKWWGQRFRDRVRETAVRFLLYYKAGYTITYTW